MTDRTLPLLADDLIDMLNDIYPERCPAQSGPSAAEVRIPFLPVRPSMPGTLPSHTQ